MTEKASGIDHTAQYWEKNLPQRDKEKNPDTHVWDFLDKYKNEVGPKIIDIGAGTGAHLVRLAEMGYQVTGAELTQSGSKIIKDKLTEGQLRGEIIRADFHDLPFDNESFDTGISIQAVQHNDWEGAKKTFTEIARVLKPNALFFLRVRSDKNPRQSSEIVPDGTGRTSIELRGKDKDRVTMHNYSLGELRELAEQNNLEILEAMDEQTPGESVKGQWNMVLRKKHIGNSGR